MRRVGRPARGDERVTRTMMLDAALDLLDRHGPESLTMRALGARLAINPMTVQYHFGSRDGLIGALSERVYGSVRMPEHVDVRTKIEGLLQAYQSTVRRHPGLTLEIFRSRSAFPEQARRISDTLIVLLRELGLSPERSLLWRDILVDFIHGAALAEAMNQARDEFEHPDAPGGHGSADGLSELLDCLGRVD